MSVYRLGEQQAVHKQDGHSLYRADHRKMAIRSKTCPSVSARDDEAFRHSDYRTREGAGRQHSPPLGCSVGLRREAISVTSRIQSFQLYRVEHQSSRPVFECIASVVSCSVLLYIPLCVSSDVVLVLSCCGYQYCSFLLLRLSFSTHLLGRTSICITPFDC